MLIDNDNVVNYFMISIFESLYSLCCRILESCFLPRDFTPPPTRLGGVYFLTCLILDSNLQLASANGMFMDVMWSRPLNTPALFLLASCVCIGHERNMPMWPLVPKRDTDRLRFWAIPHTPSKKNKWLVLWVTESSLQLLLTHEGGHNNRARRQIRDLSKI